MFTLSKIFWLLASPDSLYLILLCTGAVLTFTRWRRAGVKLLVGMSVVGVVVATVPFGTWLLIPLENRFPTVTALPDRVNGVVVLGGAVRQHITAARGQPALTGAAERMTEFVALARRYPSARLVFTGGSGSLFDQSLKETMVARALFTQLGLDVSRIVFEDRSRNTYENAVMTRELVAPKPGETWLLITSAMHMPRAHGAFAKAGWRVIPYPVDYQTTGIYDWGFGFSLSSGLDGIAYAMHEWIGLVAYRAMGWTDAIFPTPQPR
jgi:uncharacterized SAM-binding protein YcdF (DUF218 family)